MGLKKSLKKIGKKLKKAAKSVGQAVTKVVKYAAVPVGVLAAGATGGAIAAPLAALASTHRAKNKGKALKRSLISSAAVVGGGAALGLASGAGAGASLLTSVPRLLGGGEAPPVEIEGSGPSTLEDAFLDRPTVDGGDLVTNPALENAFLGGGAAAGGGLLGSLFSGAQTSRTSDPNEQGDRGGGPFGGWFGGETPPGEEGGINPLWIAGGIAVLALMSKRKAG